MARKSIPVWLANALLVLQFLALVAVVDGLVLLPQPYNLIAVGALVFAAVEVIARATK